MWKKTDNTEPQPEYVPKTTVSQIRERAIIGPSIRVKGDLSGDEDLVVQGKVEGKIELRNNNVTIGENGQIRADIFAKVISVEGQVQGNLYGEEKIIVRKSGRVRGNLVAPRVGLEDGSNFKGSIDMEVAQQKKSAVQEDKPEPAAEKKATDEKPVIRSSGGGSLGLQADPAASKGK